MPCRETHVPSLLHYFLNWRCNATPMYLIHNLPFHITYSRHNQSAFIKELCRLNAISNAKNGKLPSGFDVDHLARAPNTNWRKPWAGHVGGDGDRTGVRPSSFSALKV